MFKSLICFLLLIPLLLLPREVTLSRYLTSEVLKDTKISQKKIEKGVVIIITAKNPRVVEKIKKIITNDIRFQIDHSLKNDEILELLRVKQIKKTLTMLNNGIHLNISSKEPGWIKEIKKLKLNQLRKVK